MKACCSAPQGKIVQQNYYLEIEAPIRSDRTTLIRAVVATVLAYPLSFFFMPESVHKELDKAMKDFWWDFLLEKENKLPSKSWHQICTLKFVGGLGLIMMHNVNLVLVAKLVWKFLTHHDSLLVKLLKAKYLKREDLWSALAGAKQSWIWKAILNRREIVKEGLCFLVGNGLNIYVWKQPWIPYLPPSNCNLWNLLCPGVVS